MNWVYRFLLRRRFDGDLAQELEAHLDEKIAELMAGGIPERQAREQARRDFGNLARYQEISREVWGWAWLETLLQDVRYGARTLRADPGFTTVAAATLALAIAVNASMFSMISGLLLRKPPLADPDRAVVVVATNRARAAKRGWVSAVDLLAWRAANQSFQDLAAAAPSPDFSLTGEGDAERVSGLRVTANYFRTLGVAASLGRTFVDGEDQPGSDHVVVLSQGLWLRRFAGDPAIVGKAIALDGEKYVVVGVLPASFRQTAYLARLWTPLVLPQNPEPKPRDRRSLVLFGRLKPDFTLAQARSEMAGLAWRAEQSHPESEKGWGADVMTVQEYGIQADQVRPALQLLMAAVGLVLLIACANIANLLLARAAKRRQEIAIRIALGAGRLRVIRQLLVESLLIALMGGGAGLVGSFWGVHLLSSTLSFNDYVREISADITLDHRVLAFTCLVSIGAALAFGLAPAIRVSATDPQGTLRQGGRMGDLRRGWGRDLLVGAQIALAMLLVTGAGLIIKATAEEVGGDFGFDPKHVLSAPVTLAPTRYRTPARQTAFFQSVLESLQAMPGVEAAGVASSVPFNAEQRTFAIQGRPAVPAAERPKARFFSMSPGNLSVLGIPLVRGRDFNETDDRNAHRVALVNRVFADRFFPGESPLGRYIRVDHDAPDWSEIVGVAGNIKASFGPKEEDAQVYESYLQVPLDPEMWILVRTSGDPNSLARALRRAAAAVDPDQPIGAVETISAMIDHQEGGDYVFDALLAIFGAMALLLAAVGIYGVVAYAVAQRTHEIGIRMALGAHRADVLRLVIGQGMLLAVASAALGLAAAAPLPRLFGSMLQGYRVHGLPIFVGVPPLLLFVVVAAMYVPAARAAAVDPTEALRYE